MSAAGLAETHARAFSPDRGWSEDEIDRLLADPAVIRCGDTSAFVIGRVTLDEAEVLTVATHPDARRLGLARGCLTSFHAQARRAGALQVFLEVASDNPAARALYDSLGYQQVGERNGYYDRPGGKKADALVLRLGL